MMSFVKLLIISQYDFLIFLLALFCRTFALSCPAQKELSLVQDKDIKKQGAPLLFFCLTVRA